MNYYSDEFENDSGDESDYYSGDSFYSQTNTCKISDDIIMPQLDIPCPRQHRPDGMKCYQDKCMKVIKIISGSDEDSAYGNVVEVGNDQESFIVKWNRYRDEEDIIDIKKELRLQNAAWTLGLSPKIIQIYEQPYKDGSYVYIFMNDLVIMGYKTISEIYGLFKGSNKITDFKEPDRIQNGFKNNGFIPESVLINISRALLKLHTLGIAHKDLHPCNVFYNPYTKDVKIIDFGLSEMYPSYESAYNNENFTFSSWKGVDYDTKIPKNWSLLSELELDLLKNYNLH